MNSETSTTLDDQEEKQKTEEDEQDAEDLCADSVSLVATKGPPWYDAMTKEELNTEKVDLGSAKTFRAFKFLMRRLRMTVRQINQQVGSQSW